MADVIMCVAMRTEWVGQLYSIASHTSDILFKLAQSAVLAKQKPTNHTMTYILLSSVSADSPHPSTSFSNNMPLHLPPYTSEVEARSNLARTRLARPTGKSDEVQQCQIPSTGTLHTYFNKCSKTTNIRQQVLIQDQTTSNLVMGWPSPTQWAPRW